MSPPFFTSMKKNEQMFPSMAGKELWAWGTAWSGAARQAV